MREDEQGRFWFLSSFSGRFFESHLAPTWRASSSFTVRARITSRGVAGSVVGGCLLDPLVGAESTTFKCLIHQGVIL